MQFVALTTCTIYALQSGQLLIWAVVECERHEVTCILGVSISAVMTTSSFYELIMVVVDFPVGCQTYTLN